MNIDATQFIQALFTAAVVGSLLGWIYGLFIGKRLE